LGSGRLADTCPLHRNKKASPASIAVAKQVGSLDRIAAIEIATTRRGYQHAGSEPEKWTPDTRETADHSFPNVVARAMFDGDVNHHSFDLEKLRDPGIRASCAGLP